MSPQSQAAPRYTPVAVDLASQERSVQRQLPQLNRFLETYAEKLRVMVGKMVWQAAPVTIGPVEVMGAKSIEEVVRKWPTGAHIIWPQIGTVGYLGINPLFCYSLIDLAYGTPTNQLTADAAVTSARTRLTLVDRRTLEPTFQRLVRTLTEVLAPKDTPMASVEMLTAPFQLAIPSATDSAVICSLEFPLTGMTGSITVVLFSPVLEHLDTTASASQHDSGSELASHLKTTHVDMVTLLGTTSLLVSEMMALKPGDLLWLDRSINEDLPVLIENKLKFTAQPRQHNGTLGVKIVGRAS